MIIAIISIIPGTINIYTYGGQKPGASRIHLLCTYDTYLIDTVYCSKYEVDLISNKYNITMLCSVYISIAGEYDVDHLFEQHTL